MLTASSLIIPSIIPISNAQGNPADTLSSAGYQNALGFLSVDQSSYKFNGLGQAEDSFIHDPKLYRDLPLAVTGGNPYKMDFLNKGNIQQWVNGTLNTIFAYEIWYYYTITLYTIGKTNVIQVPSYTIEKELYHSGWGVCPDGIGTWERAYIRFKNYNISSLTGGSDIATTLADWGYLGKLAYDITITPALLFPPNITVVDGTWMYNNMYYGIIGSQFLRNEKGLAQDYDVIVDGIAVSPSKGSKVSQAPTSTGGGLLEGGYYDTTHDKSRDGTLAGYWGFTLKPVFGNLPHQILAPPNNTALVMKSINSGQNTTVPPTFDLSLKHLNRLFDQHKVRVEVPSIWMRPEIYLIEGEHSYTYVDYYGGVLGGGGGGIFGLGASHTDKEDNTVLVTLGWDVWNVYQILHIKSGVRILSTYEWNPFNETLGDPQGQPNWETGDRLIGTGVEGTVSAETTIVSWLMQFWYIIVGIIGLVIVFVVLRNLSGRKGKTEIAIKQEMPKYEVKPGQPPSTTIGDTRRRRIRKGTRHWWHFW